MRTDGMNASSSTRTAAAAGLRALRQIPGPPAWPFVGNLLQVELPRMHAQLEAWADRYGPLYRLRLGWRNALVVSRPELIAAMLRDRPDGWRRMQAMQAVIREMGSHGLFSAEGDDWRRQRRLVMAAFDPGHLKRYFASLVVVTQRLRRRLDSAARGHEAIDLQTLLMRYTVDVTAGLAFGIDINTQQQPDDPLMSHLDRMFPMLWRRLNALVPWWRCVPLPSDREFERHLATVHEAVRGFVQSARGRMAREPRLREQPSNLLEALVAARDDEGAGLSEEELIGNVLTVLLAGEDTTANTLGWLLYLLHTHRPAWDRLVAEVDAALADDPMPRSFEAARGLEFIEQCANEAMRLRPVAPLSFLENNLPTSLDGVALSSGTLVICLMRSGAVDTRLAADAAEFRPARWSQGAGARACDAGGEAAGAQGLLRASMPFGAGPRLCPGRYLAMLEIKMVIATLARNFDLIEVATPDATPPKERLAFTMFPQALKMRLAPRTAR